MMKLPNVPNKNKACFRKVSFRTKAMAQKIADKHEQRIYECPICFCFHLTSKQDWRDDFFHIEDLPRMANDIAQKLASAMVKKYKDKIKEKNVEIEELKQQLRNILKEKQ